MQTWTLLREVEVPQAVNLVPDTANLVLGEFNAGSSNLNLLTGRSFPIVIVISLLNLFGLFGWFGARIMRFKRLTGFWGLGIGKGVLVKVGEEFVFLFAEELAGELRFQHAVSRFQYLLCRCRCWRHLILACLWYFR